MAALRVIKSEMPACPDARMTLEAKRFGAMTVTFLLAAVVIASRRYVQILHPDVWVEEGTIFLPAFAKSGWSELFTPLYGYLLVPSKMVSFFGLSLSFVHFPEYATALSLIVQSACVLAVAFAPTQLPAKFLCAMAVVFVPSGTEVFLVPLYTFWWTTILIFLALLWHPRGGQYFRNALLLIGGLSSPVVVLLAPMFVLRAAVERTKSEVLTAAIALGLGATQLTFVLGNEGTGSIISSISKIDLVLGKYLGTPLMDVSMIGASVFGLVVALFLAFGLLLIPKADRFAYLLLGLSLSAAIASSIVRVPVEAPHPLLAGPRYFFLPFILLAWMLIWISMRAKLLPSLAAIALAAAFLPMGFSNFFGVPQVPKRPWAEQVDDCANAQSFTFDIQYGLPHIQWKVTLTGEDCRRLIEQSWLN